jgi:crotonobetainyl-CoA:carnitine CoA-transferase CaiB-like acyl-CoA transferase
LFTPLNHLRVLDLTTSIAGPYCTLLLGALGADVVKVERPGQGDDTRAWGPPFWNGESVTYLAFNASKRSLVVDLKVNEGRDVLLRLAERSDVFVQNLRPGLVERLRLGFEDLRARNPRIVYCSIGAFGSTGPLRHQPGYDPLMQAAGGIMSITGSPDGPGVRTGVSLVDQGTGMWAVIAILAALQAREASGEAQLIETSLYETAVNWVPYQLGGFLASGNVPTRLGSALAIIAPYEAFATSDRPVMVAAGNDALFARLVAVLGRPELAGDPRFQTNPDRVANRAALAELLGERFATASAAHWLAELETAGVPAAPVQDIREVAAHDQTAALGLLQPLPHPNVPELRLVAPPLSVDGDRVAHRFAPPALGQHSAEILHEVGYAEDDIERLVRAGVIDATASEVDTLPGREFDDAMERD